MTQSSVPLFWIIQKLRSICFSKWPFFFSLLYTLLLPPHREMRQLDLRACGLLGSLPSWLNSLTGPLSVFCILDLAPKPLCLILPDHSLGGNLIFCKAMWSHWNYFRKQSPCSSEESPRNRGDWMKTVHWEEDYVCAYMGAYPPAQHWIQRWGRHSIYSQWTLPWSSEYWEADDREESFQWFQRSWESQPEDDGWCNNLNGPL